MTDQPTVILGNRKRPLFQAISAVAISALIGWLLQLWDAVGTSPLGHVDSQLPIPLVFCTMVAIGIVIALLLVKDSWNHRIELNEQDMVVKDGLGTISILYSEIVEVKAIPWHGVGIAVMDSEQWLSRQCDAPPRQRQISGFLQSTRGVDIVLLNKNLETGTDRFVEILQERTSLFTREINQN